MTNKSTEDNFANTLLGAGYSSCEVCFNAKISLLTIMKEYIDHKWIQQTIDDDSINPSYVGRLIGDYGIRPLNNAWYRFQCIDSNLREWGQPYFASNPEKATQVCLS